MTEVISRESAVSTLPAKGPTYLRRVLEEIGIVTLSRASLDIKMLCIQRFVRCFAYGCSTLILVAYLKALGIAVDRIGVFMTLTLIGDVLISFLLTMVADGLGRKAVLGVGAFMMTLSGVVFALSGNYWVLLAASIVGVISPSGNEIGPFRAVEESTIAWLTSKENRSDTYAWYSLLGTAGVALGTLTSGWIVTVLQSRQEWSPVKAYRAIFVLYAALGLVKLLLVLMLSRKCEVDRPQTEDQPSETEPLLVATGDQSTRPKKVAKISIFPSIAKDSVPTVVKLSLLFALDTFASGLISLAWIVDFFKTKFDLPSGTLGSIFSVTIFVSAASVLVASSIAKRFGNVKTMVFTHLPSAIFLALIPIPSTLPVALVFVVLRSCSQSMDVAPRSAFLAAVLKPTERTAIMGFFSVVKTASGSIAPSITGVLAGAGLFWIAFVVAGSLKATYDIGILLVFASTEKEREVEGEGNAQAS